MAGKDITDFRFKAMEDKIDANREETKEIKVILTTFIEKADEKFATKDQHKENSARIEKMENVLSKINWLIISTVILAVLALIMKVGIK